MITQLQLHCAQIFMSGYGRRGNALSSSDFEWALSETHRLMAVLSKQYSVNSPKATHREFNTARQSAQFHTQVAIQHCRFTLAKIKICCKHKKNSSQNSLLTKTKPDRHDPFSSWSKILRDENSEQSTHLTGRLGYPYHAVLRSCLWLSHDELPWAAFH